MPQKFFVEAAGGGLLADFLKSAEYRDDKNASRKQRIKHHVSWLRKISAQYPARHWNIRIDGEDLSDRYLLWEAMNIRSAAPALNLAPRATSDDGELDFVSVREQERDVLRNIWTRDSQETRADFRSLHASFGSYKLPSALHPFTSTVKHGRIKRIIRRRLAPRLKSASGPLR